MAFMMPVIKNDYNIYPSCPGTRNGMGTPQSSRGTSLSSSPTTGASSSFVTPRTSQTPNLQGTSKSGSQISLHKFHVKVLDKLKRTFRGRDGSDYGQASTSSTTIAIR